MKKSFWRLASSVTPLFFATSILAEDEQAAVFHSHERLEHVLVTVPIHRKQAETASAVTVLNATQLRRQASANLGDTLQTNPGLNNASFGPGVGQPVIRGQQGPRVAVLQNSTSSADAANISADHAIGVEPLLAESIEILRGPATLLYGGGAIGGVINVVDNRVPASVPEQTKAALELRHASVNDEKTAVLRLDGGLAHSEQAREWAYHVDALYRSSNDVRLPDISAEDHAEEAGLEEEHHEEDALVNSDTETKALTAGLSYVMESGFIGLAINRLESDYGIPSGAHQHSEAEPDEEEMAIRIDLEQTRYDLRGDWHQLGPFIEKLRWYSTYTDYQHQELEITAEGDAHPGTRFDNETWEQRLEIVHVPVNAWHGAIGLQWKTNEFAALGEENFVPKTDSDKFGLFILEDYHFNSVTLEFGARIDKDEMRPKQSLAGNKTYSSHSLSAAVLWDPNENWNLGLALSSSERAPSTEELFSNVDTVAGERVVHAATQSIEIGNAELQQESSRNIDLSLAWRQLPLLGKDVEGYLTLFQNDFNDYIYLANTGQQQDDIVILRYQQQDTEFYGYEFESSLDLGTVDSFNSRLSAFADAIYGDFTRGSDVPRLPPKRFGLRYELSNERFSSYLMASKAERQSKAGVNETPTPGYLRWDAGMELHLPWAGEQEGIAFIKLKNITDEEIRLSTSFLRETTPEPGRSVEIGLRIYL